MADKPNPETRKVFSTSTHRIGGSIPGLPGAASVGTWRTDLSPDEVATIDGTIKSVCGVVPGQAVLACADLAKREMVACVPGKSSSKGTATTAVLAKLNTMQGTNVDWSAISGWEGGPYKEPYVPWGPAFALVDNPTFSSLPNMCANIQGIAQPDVPLEARLATAREDVLKIIPPYSVVPVVADFTNPKSRVVALNKDNRVPNNNSGVTVATGVDLGQQDKTAFINDLRDIAKRSYTDPAALKAANADIDDFAAKYGEFFGKKQAAACAALLKAIADGKNLSLSQSQVDLLDQLMHEEFLKNTVREYSKSPAPATPFAKLDQSTQTTLFSIRYNVGNGPEAQKYFNLARTGDWAAFGTALTNGRRREADYFNSNHPPPAPTGATGTTTPTAPAATTPATSPTGGKG